MRETIARLRLVPRLAHGLAAGLIGGSIIYLAGWSLADAMIAKTAAALEHALKPDLKDLIYAQTMAESLAGSDSPAGGSVQVQVLSLAESVNERSYFNTSLTAFAAKALAGARANACFERMVLARGREKLFSTPPAPPSACAPKALTDLAALRAARQAADDKYQALLSQIGAARATAQFEGDPRAEVTAAALSRQATIASFDAGELALNEALATIEGGDIAGGFEIMRNSVVGAQSDLHALEDLFSRLEYLAPQTQAWHQLHHEALADDPRWVDMKVAAGDAAHDLLVARTETSTEYQNLGGVEGSLRAYVEEQKTNNGAELAKAETAAANKSDALTAAAEHTAKLGSILQATSGLVARRVEAERNALATLLFGLQIWHLTWGVLGGLVGALIGEFLVRLRDAFNRRRRRGDTAAPEAEPRRYADAIFPLVGLMLAMVVSVRLADSLDGLTNTLIGPLAGIAITSWLGYLAAVVILGIVGTAIGGLCGRFLLPSASRDARARTDIWVTGVGGVLAGVVAAVVLRWLVGPHAMGAAASDIAATQAHLFALALIGGVFGSLIGATLIAGGGQHADAEA